MAENLLWVLGVLIIGVIAVGALLYFINPKPKASQKPSANAPKKPAIPTLEELLAIMKNRASTLEELERASGLFMAHFEAFNPTESQALEALFSLTSHPRVSSKMVLDFSKALKARLPESRQAIESTLKRGLDSRK